MRDIDSLIRRYIINNNPLSKITVDCLMYLKKSGYYRDIVCKTVIEREFPDEDIGAKIDDRPSWKRLFNIRK